ncbi:MAG: cation:proton antiporter [Candidatus Aenigmarchaeota archaeon]|nr:cation:proton antiporter [Candidatus Aenigmarchaeota archaeon]
MDLNIFLLKDIALIIFSACIISYIFSLLKQPLIPTYLIAGLIIGPSGLSLITNQDIIVTLSELGITFLLFLVGMELDFSRIKDVRHMSVAGTTIQVISTFFLGFLLSLALGFSTEISAFLGICFAFSSTMVVIKLLVDKGEIETLHGRMILGILLVQDIFAVVAISIVGTASFSIAVIFSAGIKALGLFLLAWLGNKYIFPFLLKPIEKKGEVMFLFALSVCFFFSAITHYLNFSIPMGGFLAGISLAVFPYNLAIMEKIASLRDFFSVMFFATLGMQFSFFGLGELLIPIVVFTLFILAIKPAIIAILAVLFGYTSHVAVLCGAGLAQISEFSLILALIAEKTGLITGQILSMIIALTIITMVMTAYTFKYDVIIGNLFVRVFRPLEKLKFIKKQKIGLETKAIQSKHIVLCGAHVIGQGIIDSLKKMKVPFVVIDYNPEVIKMLVQKKINCIYGDITQREILEKANLKEATFIISTIPYEKESEYIIRRTRMLNSKTRIITTAESITEATHLYKKGSDFVIIPKLISANKVSNHLSFLYENGIEKIDEIRKEEMLYLHMKKDEEKLQRYEKSFLKNIREKYYLV